MQTDATVKHRRRSQRLQWRYSQKLQLSLREATVGSNRKVQTVDIVMSQRRHSRMLQRRCGTVTVRSYREVYRKLQRKIQRSHREVTVGSCGEVTEQIQLEVTVKQESQQSESRYHQPKYFLQTRCHLKDSPRPSSTSGLQSSKHGWRHFFLDDCMENGNLKNRILIGLL